MYLQIIGILVILSMEPLATMSTSPNESTSSQAADDDRDYRNKIGMVCSYNLSNSFDHYFMEIGEDVRIDSVLERFGTNKKVIFFIAGYGKNVHSDDGADNNYKFEFEWFKSFTRGLLKDQNTIACAFDFNRLEKMGPACMIACYWNTVNRRVPFAAKMIKRVAAEMFTKNVFTTFENFQLIGFSLGAHVAGLTARRIKLEMGIEVPRIFALDPSKRILNKCSNKQIQKTDAKYIQAILTSRLGEPKCDVHCKVFIGDGAIQSGCEEMPLEILQNICSHNYVTDLYKQIAKQELTLIAYKDPDENVGVRNVPDQMTVGHHSNENACGVFYANIDNSEVKKPRHTDQKCCCCC